jgi:hypothetical protein
MGKNGTAARSKGRERFGVIIVPPTTKITPGQRFKYRIRKPKRPRLDRTQRPYEFVGGYARRLQGCY